MNAGYVSTIIRFHDPARLDRLQFALMSLCGQQHTRIEPIVLLQNFTPEDEASVRAAADELPWHADIRGPVIENLSMPEGDRRAALINAGLDRATGEFVGFLDYDDVLYPDAYARLVERLGNSEVAAAFGCIRIGHYSASSPGAYCRSKSVYPRRPKFDLFKENIYPIHSYLLRSAAVQGVRVPEDFTVYEDYVLLLLALHDREWDDALLGGPPVGEYFYWGDGTNTVFDDARRDEWARAVDKAEAIKRNLRRSVPVSYFGELRASQAADWELTGELARQARFLLFAHRTKVPALSSACMFLDGEIQLEIGLRRGEFARPLGAAVFVHSPRFPVLSARYLGFGTHFEIEEEGCDRFVFAAGIPVDRRNARTRITAFFHFARKPKWRRVSVDITKVRAREGDGLSGA